MSDQQDRSVAVHLPMKWEGIEDTPTVYANEMIVTHASGREFYLIFGEVQPPLILNPEVDKLPDVVKVKPVAKVAITPDMLAKFASAINQNLSTFMNRIMNEEDEIDD